MKIVAIDNGYWATKVYTQNERFSFRSKVEKTSDSLNTNNTFSITYAGENYLVGDGAYLTNIEYDKTIDEFFKICTYTALAKLSTFGSEFLLVVGYPLNIYSTNAKAFSNYLKTNDYIELLLNGNPKLFKILDCIVFPQGAGVLYANPEEFKNQIIAIVDIGGLTINGCIFENLNLIRETIFTENLGSIILLNKIEKILENKYNMNIQDYEMQDIIKNGIKKDKEGSLKIINEVIQSYIEELKNIMRKNNWNIDNLNILFTGGTSLLLQNHLLKIFPHSEISKDPVFDNVKGFYRVGELVYAENL